MLQLYLIALFSISSLAQSDERSSCENITCPEGMTCKVQDVSCFMPPCPQPRRSCVADDPDLSCADFACFDGQVCEQETIRCIRHPCPNPPAECIEKEPVPIPTCDSNEELLACGTACEPSCKFPEPTWCTEQCLVNVCQCKSGFLRDEVTNKCVLQNQCHEQFVSCKNRTCPEGTICHQAIQMAIDISMIPSICNPDVSLCEGFSCPRSQFCVMTASNCTSPPCSLSPECKVMPTDDPCALLECEEGFVCKSEEVACKRPPCDPVTQCVKEEKDAACD